MSLLSGDLQGKDFSNDLILLFYFLICVCLSVNKYVQHMCTWCPQKSKEGTLSPGTGVLYSSEITIWVLETKPRSSAVNDLNHRAITPVPDLVFFSFFK